MGDLVTVGVPVHNGAAFLEQALASLRAQTHEDLEIIIADNASTDATAEIATRAAADDDRIRYLRRQRNVGAAANYNDLVDRAQGRLFKWHAHDDLLAPDFIERCVAALHDAGPTYVLAFARMTEIDETGRTISVHGDALPLGGDDPASRLRALLDHPQRSHLHRCVPVMGVIRTDALRGTRRIRPHPSSDKVLIVELALRGRFADVTEPLFLRRVHPGTHLRSSPSTADVAAWFDPARRGRAPMVRTALLRGYLNAVARAPLAPTDRLRCAAEVVRWTVRDGTWRVVAGELRAAVKEG